MSEIYLTSEKHLKMLEQERIYNLERLKKLKELLDSGKVSSKRETFTKCSLWEDNNEGYCIGWVSCIGVECPIKEKATKNECPLTQNQCWWVYANKWRKEHEKEIRNRWSKMREYSDI